MRMRKFGPAMEVVPELGLWGPLSLASTLRPRRPEKGREHPGFHFAGAHDLGVTPVLILPRFYGSPGNQRSPLVGEAAWRPFSQTRVRESPPSFGFDVDPATGRNARGAQQAQPGAHQARQTDAMLATALGSNHIDLLYQAHRVDPKRPPSRERRRRVLKGPDRGRPKGAPTSVFQKRAGGHPIRARAQCRSQPVRRRIPKTNTRLVDPAEPGSRRVACPLCEELGIGLSWPWRPRLGNGAT